MANFVNLLYILSLLRVEASTCGALRSLRHIPQSGLEIYIGLILSLWPYGRKPDRLSLVEKATGIKIETSLVDTMEGSNSN